MKPKANSSRKWIRLISSQTGLEREKDIKLPIAGMGVVTSTDSVLTLRITENRVDVIVQGVIHCLQPHPMLECLFESQLPCFQSRFLLVHPERVRSGWSDWAPTILQPMWEIQTESLSSAWLSLGCCRHLRGEPVDGKYLIHLWLSVHPFLKPISISLCHSAFHVDGNKLFFQRIIDYSQWFYGSTFNNLDEMHSMSWITYWDKAILQL